MDWTDGPGTVAAVVAVLAMIGSFIGFIRTLGKERSAGRAAERAEAAEKRANEARDRAAAALEALVDAQTPKREVRWGDAEEIGEGRFQITNVGDKVAESVTVTAYDERGWLHAESDVPRDIEPGSSIRFGAIAGGSGRPTAQLTWLDPSLGPEPQRTIRPT